MEERKAGQRDRGVVLRWAFNTSSWTPSDEEFEGALTHLTAEERTKATRYVKKVDRKRSVVGRLLIRAALASVLGVPAASLQLQRTAEGRPVLQKQEPGEDGASFIDFNISHHGDWVAVVVARGCVVGVDITTIESSARSTADEFLGCFSTQFTAHEWRTIRGASAMTAAVVPSSAAPTRAKPAAKHAKVDAVDRRLAMFFWHWACKEAFVKARGIGLGFDLQRVEFTIRGAAEWMLDTKMKRPVTVTQDGKPCVGWEVEVAMLDYAHPAVVCAAPIGAATAGLGKYVEALSLPETALAIGVAPLGSKGDSEGSGGVAGVTRFEEVTFEQLQVLMTCAGD